MLKKYGVLLLAVFVLILLTVSMYIVSRHRVYSIQGHEYQLGEVVVIALQPPKNPSFKPPSTDQSTYIADGTLFLLIKNHDKLFFLPTFQQLATFSPKNTFDVDSPIFKYLYIGRYSNKNHTIYYKSLKDANIESLYFYKKCFTPEQISKLNKEIESVTYLSGYRYLDAGSITQKRKDGTKITLLMGHWIYKQKFLNSVNLKPDHENAISKQFVIDKEGLLEAEEKGLVSPIEQEEMPQKTTKNEPKSSQKALERKDKAPGSS